MKIFLASLTLTALLLGCSKDASTSPEQTESSSSSTEIASSSDGNGSAAETSSSSMTSDTSGTQSSSSSIGLSSSSITPGSSSESLTQNAQTCPYSETDSTLTCEEKTYRTVTIGTQTWMAENLAWLPSVSLPDSGSSTIAYYYVHSYNGTSLTEATATEKYSTYGALYNWTAAQTACPAGWHLPTYEEWYTLTKFVGGASTAGTVLKATTGWEGSGNGTDDYGFSALPGGFRNSDGWFYNAEARGYWWTATQKDSTHAYASYMYYFRYPSVGWEKGIDKEYGYSVRCLRD